MLLETHNNLFLLIALYFATCTVADPVDYNNTVYQCADFSHAVVYGEPLKGVTCATSKEPHHSLHRYNIMDTVLLGNSRIGNKSASFPRPFYTNMLANNSNGKPDALIWPETYDLTNSTSHGLHFNPKPGVCDLSKQLYYQPILWDDEVGDGVPADDDPDDYVSADNATIAQNFTDIVLFLPDACEPEYCAILTDSDATTADLLFGSHGASSHPSGYHQCTPNFY